MSIEWSRQSRMDLRAIFDFIARGSEHYARLQVRRIIERVEYVARMPMIGHPVHEFPELGLRETHQENFRIIYHLDDEMLQVVTIVHMKHRLRKKRLTRGD